MINMTVKAKPGAVVFAIDGNRIPERFVLVPMSPGVLRAVRDGDLEQGSAGAQFMPQRRTVRDDRYPRP